LTRALSWSLEFPGNERLLDLVRLCSHLTV
jgi:hypothetical protein